MDGTPYSGRDSLELMEDAVIYNRFLAGVVSRAAAGRRSVVDFGAGTGTFAAALDAAGHDVLCVEPDPSLREGLVARGLQAVADLDAAADGSVDLIYSLNVLEHIADDAAVLRLWRRKIRPGGRLILYVPAFQCLYSEMDRKVGHLRRYTRGTLSPLVRGAGFRIDSDCYVDSLGFYAAYLFRLLHRGDGSFSRRGLIAYDRAVFPVSRALDPVFGRLFGKNLLIDARADSAH